MDGVPANRSFLPGARVQQHRLTPDKNRMLPARKPSKQHPRAAAWSHTEAMGCRYLLFVFTAPCPPSLYRTLPPTQHNHPPTQPGERNTQESERRAANSPTSNRTHGSCSQSPFSPALLPQPTGTPEHRTRAPELPGEAGKPPGPAESGTLHSPGPSPSPSPRPLPPRTHEHARQLVQHPVLGRSHALQVLLGAAGLRDGTC